MRNWKISGLVLLFAAWAGSVSAASDKEIPPWMENVTNNSDRSVYLVPKGSKRKIIGSQVIVETPNEYVARRLYEMEGYLTDRFKTIDEAQEAIQKDLELLQEKVERLEQKDDFSADIDSLKSAVKELNEFKEATEETVLQLQESENGLEASTGIQEGHQEAVIETLP